MDREGFVQIYMYLARPFLFACIYVHMSFCSQKADHTAMEQVSETVTILHCLCGRGSMIVRYGEVALLLATSLVTIKLVDTY